MSQSRDMEDFLVDPLEDLNHNHNHNHNSNYEHDQSEYEDSLFNEPSWMEASKQLSTQRPVIPSSDLNIPHSYTPTKIKKKKKLKDTCYSANSSCQSTARSVKKYSLPENKIQDPKATELLSLCRSGWTLSKGQKNRPALGKIGLNKIDSDIQEFAERFSDAKSKSSASKGTDLNSIGERFQPHMWPNKNTIDFTRSRGKKDFNPSMFRSTAEVKESTLGGKGYSFPKDIRMHPAVVRSPGPVFDTTKAYEAVLPKHSTPVIGACGRTLAGSIYYDEFNLKSHGNYYHANEAYLNHTTAPAARVSTSAVMEPKKGADSVVDQWALSVKSATDPMKVLKDIRAGKKTKKGQFS
jgi:hypothetical protein